MSATSSVGQSRNSEIFKHVFVLLVLMAAFYPLYMMVNISTKTNKEFYQNPWYPQGLLESPSQQAEVIGENYRTGFLTVYSSIPNTIFLAVTTTACILTVAVLAAYVFARFNFPLKKLFWSLLLILMLMPGVANLIPLFVLLRNIGLLNTYTALILTGTAGAQVFNLYILRNYIEDTPETLFEAAEVDGAGHLRQIWEIVVPMNGSILATLACLAFIATWNNFLLPLLIIRDPDRLPIAVQLYRLEGAYVRIWGPTMAAYAVAAVPLVILFIFTMRFFIRGVGAGALKG
ncbi:MAG: carbohydrate ABC transporter permease [Phycisphaerae bacterium]